MFIARTARAPKPAPAKPAPQPKSVADTLGNQQLDELTNSCGARNNCGLRIGPSCGGIVRPNPCGPGGGGGLQCIGNGNGNTGAGTAPTGPGFNVDVGLEKKPALSAADAATASQSLARLRARTQQCVKIALDTNPTLPSAAMSVEVRADGVAAPVVTLTRPFGTDAAQSCIRRVIARELGADTQAAAITFPIWVEVEQEKKK
jgi:hypothetical protein